MLDLRMELTVECPVCGDVSNKIVSRLSPPWKMTCLACGQHMAMSEWNLLAGRNLAKWEDTKPKHKGQSKKPEPEEEIEQALSCVGSGRKNGATNKRKKGD